MGEMQFFEVKCWILRLLAHYMQYFSKVFNRHGAAREFNQHLFIHSFINWFIKPVILFQNIQNIITPKPLELGS